MLFQGYLHMIKCVTIRDGNHTPFLCPAKRGHLVENMRNYFAVIKVNLVSNPHRLWCKPHFCTLTQHNHMWLIDCAYHMYGMWACHWQKIKWTCSMGFCFFFQLLLWDSRQRRSKWFQQMGLALIWPSVAPVLENEKSSWDWAMQSLSTVTRDTWVKVNIFG